MGSHCASANLPRFSTIVSESLTLSATAMMSRPLTIAARGTSAAPKPTIRPTLVTMAAVLP